MFMIIYFKGATTRSLCATLNQPEAPAAAAEEVQVEAEAWGHMVPPILVEHT